MVFVAGNGFIAVEDETWAVASGDCVVIPPGAEHSVTGDADGLTYVAAATPPIDLRAFYPR